MAPKINIIIFRYIFETMKKFASMVLEWKQEFLIEFQKEYSTYVKSVT